MPLPPSQTSAVSQQLCDHLCRHHLGDRHNVELLIAGLIAGGHVLIEGAPGLGKTRLVRNLAKSLQLDFGRVQCTPDLMPTDITGADILDSSGNFKFVPGPIFKQVVLADEINRATPRSQSALLEAMEEQQVSSGSTTHQLPEPFFIVPTQNPIELEGTYPLPEAQLDRFLFKLELARPSVATITQILNLEQSSSSEIDVTITVEDLAKLQVVAKEMPIADGMTEKVAEIICASHPDDPNAVGEVRDNLRCGASPRAGLAALAGARALALVRGRAHVAPQDLKDALVAALRHRLILRYEASAIGINSDQIVSAMLNSIPIE